MLNLKQPHKVQNCVKCILPCISGEGNIYIYIYLHMHKILLGVYLKTDSIVCFQNKELDGGGME